MIHDQKKSNEWYTPTKYVEAARLVMGSIDLDPASCELANQTVKATRYYTKEDNGLMQPWYGRVWLNPPYCLAGRAHGGLFKSTIENFSDRLIDEYEQGRVKEAIMLVIAKVDTQWFQRLWDYSLCFPSYAVKFNGPKSSNPKNTLKQLFGTVFVYLGPNEAKFTEVFSRFGRIVRAIDTPPVKPAMRELWEVIV